MQTPLPSLEEQKRRAKIVSLAIGFFVLLFCLFLTLLYQDMRNTSSPVSLNHKNTNQLENISFITRTPFQPNTSMPLEGNDELFPKVVTPSLSESEPTKTLVIVTTPTDTPFQILQPKTEETPFPLYIVKAEDQLNSIARAAKISPETLRNANFMYGDAIFPGQALIIPPSDSVSEPEWRFASLDKDQANIFYPFSFKSPHFCMHYMPNTYPAVDPSIAAGMIEHGLEFVEQSFGKPIDYMFDAYISGTLFEQPNAYLLGRSFSEDRKEFFLFNGSGDSVYNQYLAAHELTHLYAWNRFGQPFSFLLSEGAAVYTGMKMISGSRYLPIKTFCVAYKIEGKLPLLYTKTELIDFRGHNNNLVNYYSSGCMVGYLIETYGVERFGQLYGTQDFEAVYGKTQEQLEREWKDSIVTDGVAQQIDAPRLVHSVDEFMAANDDFFPYFYGSSRSIHAYELLDKARLALLSGDLDGFNRAMQVFQVAPKQ